MDEVFAKIGGRLQYLWRAVDQDGDVIDILVQKCRTSAPANASASCDASSHQARRSDFLLCTVASLTSSFLGDTISPRKTTGYCEIGHSNSGEKQSQKPHSFRHCGPRLDPGWLT